MDLKKLELAKEKLNGLSMNSIYKNDKHVKNSLDYIINELLDSEYLREKFRTADYTTLSIGMVKNNLSDVYFLTHKWLDDQIELMEIQETKQDDKKSSLKKENKVFIIHGHDGELKEKTARIIESQGIEVSILSETVKRGGTILENLIREINGCKAAVVLYSPDDKMGDSYQARPNVIFEHGFAISALGRENVIMISNSKDVNLTLHSDISGLLYIDAKNNFKYELLDELKDMGFEIDKNK